MKRGIVMTVLISLVVLGCGQQQQRQLKVTYLSDPPDGTLYRQNGELWGSCPKVLWYDLNEETLAAGQLQVQGLIVRWPSGPEERSAATITFPIDQLDQQFTFVQSQDVASDRHTPRPLDRDTAAIPNVTFEQDTGLSEQPDEQIEPTKETAKTAEVVDVPEEKDDSAQARSQQNTELHEEPDEQIEPTKETANTAEVVDVTEEKDDSAQARSQQDTELHEEPDEQIEPTKETANTAEVVDDVTKEKDDSVQARSDQDAGQSEEPDEENVQAAGRSTTAEPEDLNAERQAQTDSGRDSLGDPPLQRASVPQPKVDLIAESPKGANEESVQPRIETKTVDLGNGVLIEFEFGMIPAGKFLMGSGMGTKKGESGGDPTQRVIISKPFYMSVNEVTQEQYEKVVGKNPSRFPGAKRPVETVSWYDAQEFCRQLSEVGSVQCRLPTEAEWEYACRAGTTTAYYWGDDFESRYAWTLADREAETCDVGTKQPNAWGLHDMSGNVWEWCSDWYGRRDLSSTELTDPKGPDNGTFRLLRGGSWGHSQTHCRSGHRNWHTPNHRYDNCGFRIVMEVEQTPEAPPAP